MSNAEHIELASGTLTVVPEQEGNAYLHELCDFASRQNPKRGFLFVSKVLGKHIPAKPSEMRGTYEALAHRLIPALSSAAKVMFLGFAETATGLGAGVFDSTVRKLSSHVRAMYQQTTRYHFDAPVAMHFQEEHSHATGHLVYEPKIEPDTFFEADTLVLVDDELSTGKTAANFLKEFLVVNPRVERVYIVSLLNWMNAAQMADVRAALPGVTVNFVALLFGQFAFTRNPNASKEILPPAEGSGARMDARVPISFGRFGENRQSVNFDFAGALRLLDLNPAMPVRVVGDGEYLYAPFRFAECLEQRGFEVTFQSTTRSPIHLGHAIKAKTTFKDHYGEGLDNHVYNLPLAEGVQTVLCTEVEGVPALAAEYGFKDIKYQDFKCA